MSFIYMKKVVLLLLSTISIYCTSCDNQKCCVAPVYNYYINAQKDGAAWGASPANSKISTTGDTITVMGTSDDIPSKVMGFKFKYTGTGKYVLKGENGFYYYSIGPSSFMNNFTIDSAAVESYVIVEKFDRAGNSVSGTFSLRLIRSPDTLANTFNHVSFLNGKFKVTLHN
jgi:Family of unknown function (DUF6252)